VKGVAPDPRPVGGFATKLLSRRNTLQ
jgi:hypothetical protein